MRPELSLVYDYNEKWIGGTYYLLNIIKALNTLEDDKKPRLKIIADVNTPWLLVDEINYPYLDKHEFKIRPGLLKSVFNKFYKRVMFEDLFKKRLPKNVGSVYPLDGDFETKKGERHKFYWIPDLQEKNLPHYFTSLQKRLRKRAVERLIENDCNIVFSSETAFSDFKKFYPISSNKTYILRFGSIVNSDFKHLDIDLIRTKYELNKKYFFCPNQLWKHKNHTLVIEALKIIAKTNSDLQVVFTGKEFDHRNPEYAERLKNDVINSGLAKQAIFLGFIDRDEQLQLMNHALAVIQPSRFEGWSTVVEDAKALNKFVMVSDITIHREQAKENCVFFDMDDPNSLADIMMYYYKNPVNPTIVDYSQHITRFAEDLIGILLTEK